MVSRFQSVANNQNVNLAPTSIETLQLNITKLCNQACLHCHVDSSPRRREMMTDAVYEQILNVLESHDQIKNLDLTGGAPELHPKFKDLVRGARKLGKNVWVRHNLTVTLDPHPMTKESMSDLPEFFKETGVTVISSLPCYKEENTNQQRGDGVFQKSIDSLKLLNAQGFGIEGSENLLNLVYNPIGSHLPPDQAELEADYKEFLSKEHGIHFNNLYTITNMPIHRFKFQLKKSGDYESYLDLLSNAFNPVAANDIMCRSLVSISHDGQLFDCDFNQMLKMPLKSTSNTIFSFDFESILKREIFFADHCFGCTAGSGSSCGGALEV